ncbi:MAG: ABC transporter permease [Clostridiales bacterium]|nr:ABC transporter permease [Clostridiales bacterium]
MRLIIKKVLTLIITLILISLAAFFAFQIIPGDPATAMLKTEATPERVAALREEMGLNDPVIIRYFRWIVRFVQGDMGISYNYGLPVEDLIQDKIIVTTSLALLSLLVIIIFSLPLGFLMARYADKLGGKIMKVSNQIVMAIPSFFLGVLIVLVFGLILKWFIPGEYISHTESVYGFLKYLLAPAIAIAIPKIAMLIKFLRDSVIKQKKTDYVRTAYSKGNTESRVLYVHVLKNACISVITLLGMMIADIMAGSIVIEQVFNLPGLGRLLVASIGNRDFPVVQAIIIYIATIVVIVNFLVDILYRWIDPRIRVD